MSFAIRLKWFFGRCHEPGCWQKGLRRSYFDMSSVSLVPFAKPSMGLKFECLQCEKHMHQELTNPDSMPVLLAGRCRTCIGEKKVVVRRFVDGDGKVKASYSPAYGGRPDVPDMEVADCPKCVPKLIVRIE